MSQQPRGDGCGCAALFAVLFLFAAVVASGISLAALVDPFGWMPPLAEIWADCDDDYGTSDDECALEARFDGFWLHVAVNLAYAVLTGILLVGLAFGIADFRKARSERFAGREAADRYAEARASFIGGVAVVSTLAAIPIIVAAL